MRYIIRGNVDITPAIENYLREKIDRILKFFPEGIDATVHANVKIYDRGKKQKVEVTVKTPSDFMVRAEETKEDLYASIDLVVDKLERQIRKHKTKVNRKSREKGFPTFNILDVPDEKQEESEFEIIRTKKLNLKPMDVQEAIMQMEMLSHDFFIYEDGETGSTNIVYKRKNGSYGLIETN